MATKTTKRTTTPRKTTTRTKTAATAKKASAAKTAAPKGTAAATPAKTATKTATQTLAAKTTPTAAAAPAKAKVTAPAPAPDASADKPTVVTDTPVVAGPTLRKKDFIDRVVARSGLKKRDAKPLVEAALAELGEAIARGEELNLPPFGKLKVNREKDLANAHVLICKLRRPKGMDVPPGAKDPLANAAE